MIEKDFVTEGLKRTRIDEYLENELERAGYGGMEIQVTPLGTMVVVYAERPGMVIGRGGKTVRNITQQLKNNYNLENPQVEVKEVEIPELNPKIMAHKIAAMLQRGMHFRRVAYTALRRIMGAGAQGVEVTISGKIRGSRSACAKFIDGYIKKCGEPSTRFVREGFATVQLKPGVLGIYVRIMPPGTILPDKVDIIQPPVEETQAETVVEEPSAPAEDVETVEEESISDQLEDETAEATEDIEAIEEEAAEEPVPEPVEEEVPAEEPEKDVPAAEPKEEPAAEKPEEKPAEPAEEPKVEKPKRGRGRPKKVKPEEEKPAEEPKEDEPKVEKPKRGRPKKEKPAEEPKEDEPKVEKPKRGRPKKEKPAEKPEKEEPKKTFKTAELVKPAGAKK